VVSIEATVSSTHKLRGECQESQKFFPKGKTAWGTSGNPVLVTKSRDGYSESRQSSGNVSYTDRYPEVVLITTPASLMTNPEGNGKECQKSGSSFGCDEEYHG